ncbi:MULTISPECIES: hypothetical protein [Streptomyces]|uniref:hypothetical protein n=1 Tax=Streptomyces TaxID=1883 RepID=UPI0036B4B653
MFLFEGVLGLVVLLGGGEGAGGDVGGVAEGGRAAGLDGPGLGGDGMVDADAGFFCQVALAFAVPQDGSWAWAAAEPG